MYGCNRPFWPLPYAKAYSLELDWILAELRKLQEGGLSTPIESIIQSIDEIKATLDSIVAAPGIVYDSQNLGGHAPEYFLAPLENVQQSIDEIRETLTSIVESPGTVYNAQKLGGKSPEYYLTTQNLLDNGDFRNPVNQRNITSGTTLSGYEYFFDRWRLFQEAAAPISYTVDGLTLNQITVAQAVENVPSGRVLTGAIKLSDGTVVTASGTISYNSDGSWIRCAYGTDEANKASVFLDTFQNRLDFVIYTYQEVTIEWAALYDGTYTAETLPPYVPKGFAVELAACQRYAVSITDQMRIRAASISDNTIEVFVPLPTLMRAGGLPSIDSSAFAVVNTLGVEQADFTFAVIRCDGNGMLLRGTKNAHGLSDGEIRTTTRTIVSRDL